MAEYGRVIVWRITQRCNMNCLFCAYAQEVARLRDKADTVEIIRVLGVLREYKAQSQQKILMSWIGGEPFLCRDIFRLSALCKSYGIDVSATTNGLLLDTEEARSNVLQNFSEIVFSLDGFAACHDRIRQSQGAFATTSRAIARLCAQKASMGNIGSALSVQVNTILLRENIGRFPAFCEYLASLGVNSLTFNPLGGFDRPEFYDDNRLLPEQVARFSQDLPRIKKECAARGLTIQGGKLYLERIRASAEDQKMPLEECQPGKWFWFINEHGFISPCSYTSREYRLPTNTLQTIHDIDHAKRAFREMRKCRRSHWCEDCRSTQNHEKFLKDDSLMSARLEPGKK